MRRKIGNRIDYFACFRFLRRFLSGAFACAGTPSHVQNLGAWDGEYLAYYSIEFIELIVAHKSPPYQKLCER